MTSQKCPVCGLVLLEKMAQLRSDDEAAALVRWCPIHGIHYNLCSSYLNVKLPLSLSLQSNPSRLVPCLPVDAPNRLIASNLIFNYSWVQCRIKLNSAIDVDNDVMGVVTTEEFKYASANDSINLNGMIRHIQILKDNPMTTKLCNVSYCSKISIDQSNDMSCIVEKIMIASVNSKAVHNSWNLVSGTITWIKSDDDHVAIFIMNICNIREFYVVYRSQAVKQMKLASHSISSNSQRLCAKLLGDKATISRSISWHPWVTSLMLSLSNLSGISIAISEISPIPGAHVSITEHKGTYSALYVSQNMVINRSGKSAKLINCVFDVSNTLSSCIYFCIGYSADNGFGILKLLKWTSQYGLMSSDVNIREIINPMHGQNYSLNDCSVTDQMRDNWRVAYVGNQSLICFTRVAYLSV